MIGVWVTSQKRQADIYLCLCGIVEEFIHSDLFFLFLKSDDDGLLLLVADNVALLLYCGVVKDVAVC